MQKQISREKVSICGMLATWLQYGVCGAPGLVHQRSHTQPRSAAQQQPCSGSDSWLSRPRRGHLPSVIFQLQITSIYLILPPLIHHCTCFIRFWIKSGKITHFGQLVATGGSDPWHPELCTAQYGGKIKIDCQKPPSAKFGNFGKLMNGQGTKI